MRSETFGLGDATIKERLPLNAAMRCSLTYRGPRAQAAAVIESLSHLRSASTTAGHVLSRDSGLDVDRLTMTEGDAGTTGGAEGSSRRHGSGLRLWPPGPVGSNAQAGAL